MSRAKIIDFYLTKLDEKNFDIYDVRKELEKNNIDEEEIKIIMKILDNEVQRKVLNKSNNDQSNAVIGVGLTLTTIGAGVTLGTYLGFMPMGNSFLVAYGPFLAGLSILFAGLARKKK